MLSCKNLWKIYGSAKAHSIDPGLPLSENISSVEQRGGFVALADIDLSVAKGEILVIMGLSGSGKSTLLRCLTRLVEPTAGELRFEGQDLRAVPDKSLQLLRRTHMSMVFQNFALLPHRTVVGNVELPLEIQGVRAADRRQKALDMIGLVGLSGKEDHYPHELSGGQQQRVGIARSLSTNPSLWLLDEPFSALDPLIREEMQDEILRLQKTLSKTAVFVTHDFNEAARVGDRIALLRKGQLVQTGSAAELILNPADSYVRAFTASAERSRILTAENFMQPGEPGAFDVQLETEATLREVAETFQGGASVIAFGNSTGTTVGFMRRQDLGDALTSAMTA
ncbi:ATP-binding cassette domain-containing protein [Mesorhizobium sp. WSM4976]|uniref:ATP-binding cassette domain-containing protein n=1 Tax=Mesorhizobium sp. WSM4976 TaxID=3038549 RepID=UPI002417DFF4|nr:ATP-binding cassette domain-containing protein [Mesorhizobium sp. WSM4976]MDG4897662.1 ATP-binding cassette domain-containing protein [Mesorhizobium sp. WSM4976]